MTTTVAVLVLLAVAGSLVAWLLTRARRSPLTDSPAEDPRDEPSAAAERWSQVERVLGIALEMPTEERSAFLDRECAGQPEVRSEVESLLAAHEAPGLLDRPFAGLAGALLVGPHGDSPAPNGTVSQYELLEELGRGGMGVVHKARDNRLGRTVALKFLPPHLSADPDAKQRLLVEAQAAAALDHPNICTIHEIGETRDGQLYIVMPFYEGLTLKSRIARGALPVREAVELAIRVARGLERAHQQGIVHRDIKPANLIILPDGNVKILDFGIAKLDGVNLTQPGRTPGTVAYMSPEQARGEALDARTDVWSLGVVLYEMLTGERPFQADDEPVLLRLILDAELPPVTRKRPEVRPELVQVIDRALAREPAARFRHAGELARALEATWAEGAVHTPPATAGAAGTPPPGGLPDSERRPATIVASTVSRYADLVERLVPEELHRTLRELEQVATHVAHRHGGTLGRFSGEELLMLFGIPTAGEDDPRRATRAALELHERARELAMRTEQQPSGIALHLHTGIDSGLVVAQPTTEGTTHRVTGSAVQVATRLAAHAGADEIYISPECRRLIGAYFETEPGEPLPVREREQPIRTFRVVRESNVETRLEAAERGGLTRYVGRDAELATLRRSLESAMRGEGQLVTVVGEAGMGKSRLLHELRQELDREQLFLMLGRCQSYGGRVAYLPFIEMLRGSLRLGEPESSGDALEPTLARIREIGTELEEFIPLYLHLLSIPNHGYPVPKHLHGDQFRLAMQEALAALLTLSTRRRPGVVLLEDWHWADDASHAVLRQLVEILSGYPLLVVITYRPEYAVDLDGLGHHVAIPLAPLEPSSAVAMLKSYLRVDTFPEELGARIHERTGGNPFYLEEVCQTLVEEGAIRVEGRAAVLVGSLQAIDLPDTVQAVIRARLDRLDRDARELLRLASVIGREFTRGILEHTLTDSARLPHALDRLRAAGLIQQIRIVPEPAYRFKHVLTQEVAYASLLEHQRRTLHGRVGEAIEELHRHRLQDHLDRLAYHFSRAEQWSKAVHYGLRSAERVNTLAQFSEALQLLERTQRWLIQLPDAGERQDKLIEILLRQERLCETLGFRGRQQQLIDELVRLLASSGDRAKLAEAYLRQGDLYTLLRRFDQAEEALGRSLALRRELGDAVGERNTVRSLGLLRWHQDRNVEALSYIEQALEIDRERGDLEAIVGDLSNLGSVLKALGEFVKAQQYLEEALELSQGHASGGAGARAESELHVKRAYILHHLGNVHRERGDDERALDYFRQAVELSREKRLPIQDSFHLTAIAHIYLQQGRIEESLQYYRDAIELTRRAKFAPGLSQALSAYGEVLLGIGRRDEALAPLDEAAALFAQLEDHETEALIWSKIASAQEQRDEHAAALAAWSRARSLRSQAGDAAGELEALEGIARVTRRHVTEPSLALGYYREALALADRLEDLPAQGRLHNTIGILAWGRGEYAEALLHYERAAAIYEELEDPVHTGLMLNSVGATLKSLGRWQDARARLEEALALHHSSEQRQLEGHALALVGEIHCETGEVDRALECFEHSLRIRRQIGDRRGEGWMLHHLARAHLTRGADEPARQLAVQSEAIARETRDRELADACALLRRTPAF